MTPSSLIGERMRMWNVIFFGPSDSTLEEGRNGRAGLVAITRSTPDGRSQLQRIRYQRRDNKRSEKSAGKRELARSSNRGNSVASSSNDTRGGHSAATLRRVDYRKGGRHEGWTTPTVFSKSGGAPSDMDSLDGARIS